MRRRDFIQGLTIAAGLPAIARAQQGQPVVGFLSTRAPEEAQTHTNAFRRGLEEMGYAEGRNVVVEYRWAKGDYGQLPRLAADLRDRRPSLVVAAGDPAAKAAKAANFPVPMVFVAKPDELPVSRPTKFELVINTKTAKTLGLAIPPAILIEADELIE